MTFEQIKKNYDHKCWNKQMVGKAVEKGLISTEEYQQITGDTFSGALSTETADGAYSTLQNAYNEGVDSIDN